MRRVACCRRKLLSQLRLRGPLRPSSRPLEAGPVMPRRAGWVSSRGGGGGSCLLSTRRGAVMMGQELSCWRSPPWPQELGLVGVLGAVAETTPPHPPAPKAGPQPGCSQAPVGTEWRCGLGSRRRGRESGEVHSVPWCEWGSGSCLWGGRGWAWEEWSVGGWLARGLWGAGAALRRM